MVPLVFISHIDTTQASKYLAIIKTNDTAISKIAIFLGVAYEEPPYNNTNVITIQFCRKGGTPQVIICRSR